MRSSTTIPLALRPAIFSFDPAEAGVEDLQEQVAGVAPPPVPASVRPGINGQGVAACRWVPAMTLDQSCGRRERHCPPRGPSRCRGLELAVGEDFEGEGGEVPLPGCCVVEPTRSGLPYVDGFGQSGLTIRQARAPGINRNEGKNVNKAATAAPTRWFALQSTIITSL